MKRKLFGISATLAVLLAFGLVLASCGGDDDDDPPPPGGGGIPDELVGKWSSDGSTALFEIKSDGKIIIGESPANDVSVSSGTVTMTMSGTPMGSFDYTLDGDTMTITSGTGACTAWPMLPSLTKIEE